MMHDTHCDPTTWNMWKPKHNDFAWNFSSHTVGNAMTSIQDDSKASTIVTQVQCRRYIWPMSVLTTVDSCRFKHLWWFNVGIEVGWVDQELELWSRIRTGGWWAIALSRSRLGAILILAMETWLTTWGMDEDCLTWCRAVRPSMLAVLISAPLSSNLSTSSLSPLEHAARNTQPSSNLILEALMSLSLDSW
jgi:hypothetical protein